MLKRMSIHKIKTATLALFVLILLNLIPDNNVENKYALETNKIEYIYNNAKEVIYTLDSNDYIARTIINGCNCNNIEASKDSIETLIVDGKKESEMPNGFKAIIPEGTEILNLDLKDKTLTINFSKELLEVKKEYEEKMIEAIVYTLTNINGIEKVKIKVEGKTLEKLPKSGKILKEELDRNYGINKVYNINSPNNIDSYTVYYVSKYNDEEYYVPVTKYVNTKIKDKVKVIINELSSSLIYEDNLMSYLNKDTYLIDYKEEDNKLKLNFNEAIYNDKISNNILEEVIYTISLSIGDNYNIKEVIFEVNNEEIYKKDMKTIE